MWDPVVDKVALRQVSSLFFGFPCHFSSQVISFIILGQKKYVQQWPAYQVDSPRPQELKKNWIPPYMFVFNFF
jgi:hypothetical protein